jgi:hypothetical protein
MIRVQDGRLCRSPICAPDSAGNPPKYGQFFVRHDSLWIRSMRGQAERIRTRVRRNQSVLLKGWRNVTRSCQQYYNAPERIFLWRRKAARRSPAACGGHGCVDPRRNTIYNKTTLSSGANP